MTGEGAGAKLAAESSFADGKLLARHFGDHGKEFGAKTASQYESMAKGFLSNKPGTGVLEKVRQNGDIVRFNPTTDEFGVAAKNGMLRTYFKPDPAIHGYKTNLEYFNAQ